MRYEKRRKGYDSRKFSTYVLLITGSVGRVTEFVIVWEWEAGKGSGYVQKRRGNTTSQIRMGRDRGKEEGN